MKKIQKAVKELLVKHFKISTTEGTLSIKKIGVQIHGPAIALLLNWHSVCADTDIEISVDLVPAIEVNDIDPLVHESDTYSSSVFEELKRTGRVHLTPAGRISPCKEGMCFQIACSETEVKLIKRLNLNHKKCYKILKDIFDTRNEIGTHMIISYVLKTLILKHASECTERKLSGACIIKLLRTVDDNYLPDGIIISFKQQINELSSVFFIEQNIFCFKENNTPMEALDSSSKQQIQIVERVRKEYPIKDEQIKEVPNVRIKVKQDLTPDDRFALFVFSLPLSNIIPMFLVYFPDLFAGFPLSKLIYLLTYLIPVGFLHVARLQTWLCMLKVVCRSGRIFWLAFALWLYMPLSKRIFVLMHMVFLNVFDRAHILQMRDAFSNDVMYSLWNLFLHITRPNAINLILNVYVISMEKDFKLIIEDNYIDNLLPMYLFASMSFMYYLNVKHTRSCLRSRLLSRLICLLACSMWLLIYILWGDPNYFLVSFSGFQISFILISILSTK